MELTVANAVIKEKHTYKRFASLDFSRGLAIILMLVLHVIMTVLDIDGLYAKVNDIPILNLIALILLPFMGGLASFFLLVSSVGNMVSMYNDLERGNSVKSIVVKQVIGGFLLLIFAMLCEGVTGYYGLVGNFFSSLNNPLATDWRVMLWRWNHFETIHTIAWCLIVNGCIQGLLSLKERWKDRTNMIIIYVLLAVVVIGFTDTIWTAVGQIIPGYPFATDILPSGNQVYTPKIGTDPFWYVIVTPFLNMLAGSIEPCFPYFAVSFIGSIIGIVLTKPKNEINKKFPRNMLLIGLGGYTIGVAGIISVIVKLINTSYSTADSIDVAIAFYRMISFHRHWFPDAGNQIYGGLTINIPPLSWLWQFLCLTGFSLMLFMLSFRLVEFRGISKGFANNTKMIRRFGVVAFSNYNNQWLFRLMFFITSLIITQVAYKQMFWGGTFLTVLFTFIIYIVILLGWEKIGYILSLEWFIRTVTNNAIPIRRKRFSADKKWWQRGQIDVENSFKNPEWINIVDDENPKIDIGETARSKKKLYDSNLALVFSLIGFFSVALILLAIPAFFVSIASIRKEGKNAKNITALVFSVLTLVLMIGGIITMSILKIGLLDLFPSTSLF